MAGKCGDGFRLKKVRCRAGGWVYHGVFRAPGLPERQRSLGTANERTARIKARELQGTAMSFSRASGPARSWSLSEIWDRYLVVAEGRGKSGLAVDRQAWASLQRFCGDVSAAALTRERVTEWIAAASGRQLAAATVRTHVTRCKLIWGRACGLLSPFAGQTVRRETSAGARRPFTREQVVAILKATKTSSPGHYHLSLLMSETGLRLGDACRLAWDAVNLQGSMIRLRMSKTGREVEIPISPQLLKHLSGLRRLGPAVCLEMAELYGRAGGDDVLADAFALILNRLKLSRRVKLPGRKRVSTVLCWHSFRHYFIKELCRAKVPTAVIMSITGHRSADLILHYSQQVSLEEKLAAVAAIKR